ncbi:WAP, Kazal, immunoglobulin, Kunitz and NTR domain-containing protein 2-like [Anopheles cruzii]|uniref:WAP, Kazal, immunoglobulin, Kunitz and NTR domain-containing protein 2-like n=1 Tax=Anopheles cruzii TaxID=68878 RepID=UPI0022EC83BE|nr:WAP, Kazal, immunoglobulin, Kunitz and NTR domain-containing protein 2-like [Anopheles cruzii]
MAKTNIVLILLLVLVVIVRECSSDGDCPPAKVPSCTPRCRTDRDCSGTGGKCCPNLCNTKSCVDRTKLTQGVVGSKYGSSTGAGIYCGNVKCNSFEKCGADPVTKRPKCVRA